MIIGKILVFFYNIYFLAQDQLNPLNPIKERFDKCYYQIMLCELSALKKVCEASIKDIDALGHNKQQYETFYSIYLVQNYDNGNEQQANPYYLGKYISPQQVETIMTQWNKGYQQADGGIKQLQREIEQLSNQPLYTSSEIEQRGAQQSFTTTATIFQRIGMPSNLNASATAEPN